ncbi:DUF2061 domain-containing protein [Acidobacteriota bacterium]
MGLYKLKQLLLNLIRNFLTDDYASWQLLDLSNFKRQKSRTYKKKKENSQNKKGKNMALETHARAWVKSLVWRILGTVILVFISWVITHSWKEVTVITVIFYGIRAILYYLHERLWEGISWGRVKHPLSIFPVKKELEPEDLILIQNQLRQLGYLD